MDVHFLNVVMSITEKLLKSKRTSHHYSSMSFETNGACDTSLKKHVPIVYVIKGGEHVFVLYLRHIVSIPRD